MYHRIVLIRDFTMADYDAVLALWQTAGDGIHLRRSDSREEIEQKLRHDPDLFLLAEEGGRTRRRGHGGL